MTSDDEHPRNDGIEAGPPLTDGHARFEHAERAAKIGYWRHDLIENRTYWSPGMYNLLGLNPKEQSADADWLMGHVVDADVSALQQKIAIAIQTRSPFSYRTRAKDPNVPARIVDTHGEVEVGADGQVVALIGISHDVTERVAAEEARCRAEEMYRIMAEQASDIIVLYDAAGNVQFASEALQRILKRSPKDVDGTQFLDLVHPDDLQEAKKLTVGPAPGEVRTASYRARHGDGHYVWIEASTRGIYDEDGTLQGLIGVSRDITERKTHEFEVEAARIRAEAANTAKSTFLANMSHELRTPLNAIIGFADVMRQKMFGPIGTPRYDEYIRLIHESGQLLLDLISDVLDMAKIEAGKLSLSFEPVELHAVAMECVHLLEDRARKSGVTLEFDAPSAAMEIEADRRAVKQVLLNLLSNAVKFTLPGGAVRVRLQPGHSQCTLSVSDNGVGIPAQDLPRLGRPFEQARVGPALAKGGTGLGLALVHALTGKHGGQVWIESEEGVGTTVSVTLPITQDVPAHAPENRQPASNSSP